MRRRVTIAYEPARCAVCGHNDAEPLAEPRDIRSEVEDLWAFHQRRLLPNTPTARLMDRVAFSEHPPWRLVRCRECGLVYRNPAERRHELTEIYAREAPTTETLESLHDTQLSSARAEARRLRKVMGRGGSVLEVGSYVGAFLTAARELGLAVQGLDVNASVNAFARGRGFAVHDGDLASLAGEDLFDAIAIWNTFDQVPDPRATLFAAARLLRRIETCFPILDPHLAKRVYDESLANYLADNTQAWILAADGHYTRSDPGADKPHSAQQTLLGKIC